MSEEEALEKACEHHSRSKRDSYENSWYALIALFCIAIYAAFKWMGVIS